jgi:hypothetical protein
MDCFLLQTQVWEQELAEREEQVVEQEKKKELP